MSDTKSENLTVGSDEWMAIHLPKDWEMVNFRNRPVMASLSETTKTQLFIARSKTIHGHCFGYEKFRYVGMSDKSWFRCNGCGTEFLQNLGNHISGRGCEVCQRKETSRKKLLSGDEFLTMQKTVHGKKFDYSFVKYLGAHVKVKISCLECNSHFLQTPNNHLSGCGCPKCSKLHGNKKKRTTTEEFIQKAIIVHGDACDYSLVNYVDSRQKVEIKCKSCANTFHQNASDHLRGHGCPICKMSKGERKIEGILKHNNIIFIREFVFPECKNLISLRFDFYIPDFKIAIEYDGEQHYRQVERFGGEPTFRKTKLRDEKKNKFCEENDILLIRIGYRDNLEETMNLLLERITHEHK